MKLSEIIYDGEFFSNSKTEHINIDIITTSIEDITGNALFVVVRSINFDVNRIISDVIKKSPAAIVCDNEFEIKSTSVPIIRVADTRTILPYLFSRFYEIDYSKMKFCAVTGTNGKTSTATMLSHILRYDKKSVGFIGTGKVEINGVRLTDFKYSMTTPDPKLLYYYIKMMENAGCEFVVMEVSSHALYFKKVLPIPYEISIFTNLSPEHMDFHKTMEDYYRNKLSLFKQSKIGIFNTDDKYSKRAMNEASCKKLCIGILNDADVMARDVVLHGLEGSQYIYREKARLFKVRLKLGGAFNVYNSMMALCAAISLKIDPGTAKSAISELDFIDGRLEIIRDDITVIIDYAHTEEALKNILKTLNSDKKQEQKIITVFGCGGERDKLKRPKMAKIAQDHSDLVIVTNDNPRGESEDEIIKEVVSGFDSNVKLRVITSRKAAITHAILTAEKGDIVAVIGKGHERYSIDKNGLHTFDERIVIEEAMRQRKNQR